MIVITGEPRSGTSLMMRIINSLGLEISGDQNPGKEQEDDKRQERANYLNPEGFWEVSGIVSRGIRTEEQIEKYKDKAIKIITHGLSNTVKPAIDKIDKIIFCLRNPREIAYSQQKLVSTVEVSEDESWGYAPEHMKVDLGRYILSIGEYILKTVQTDLWDKTLVVYYEDLINNGASEIKKISKFLEVPYNPETHKIIRKDLYRSVEVPEVNDLANDLFNSIKTKDFTNVLEPIREYLNQKRLESVKWLDDIEYKTWVIAGWDLHKSLKINNNNVRTNLTAIIDKRILPTKCNYYKPTGEEYTIERVVELGPLTRTKINCEDKGKEITREQCFNCWQRMKWNSNI
ncbi:MAG: sulfotransferase domain-containing protein [Promethearchaeota archaeon]